MLLTIHNLPIDIRYSDVKSIIQSKCGLTEVILDNLVSEGKTKKVTVGLAEEGDAALLVRKLNGVYLSGMQLYVEDVRQKKASEQPYRAGADYVNTHNSFQSRGNGPDNGKPYGSNQSLDYEQSDRLQSFDKPQQRNNLSDDRYNYQDSQPTYNDNQQTYQDNQMMYAAYQYQMMKQNEVPIPIVPAEYNMPYFMTPMAQTQKKTSFMNYSGVPQPVESPFAEKRIKQDPPDFERRESYDQRNNRSRETEIYERRPSMDRQRQTSPVRGQGSSETGFNKRFSRWGDSDALASDMRRRSPLPVREALDSRDRYQNSTHFAENELRAQEPHLSRYSGYPESDYRNRESSEGSRQTGYGQRPTDRAEMFTSNEALVGQVAPVPDRPSRVFGSHATNPHIRGPAPSWNESANKGNRLHQNQELKSFPSRPRLGDNRFQSQTFSASNDRNRPRLGGGKPIQPRFPDRSGGRPLMSAENRRQETVNTPFKRPYDKRDVRNEPQSKRIAGPNKFYPTPVAAKAGTVFKSPSATRITGRNPNPNSKLEHNSTRVVSLMARDQTWRAQAASQIAKEVLRNLELADMDKKDKILKHLKKSVRSRIEVLLSDRLAVPEAEIVELYRRKFPLEGDQAFFLAVLENISASEDENASKETHDTETAKPVGIPAEVKKEVKGMKAVPPKAMPPKATPPKAMIPQKAKIFDLKPVPGSFKIPKYPNAKQKKIQKEETQNVDMYQLPPLLKEALDQESDVLCDLFMSVCETPDCEAEKAICEGISDQAADDFIKVMKLNVTKRLLNIKTSLLVRIFSHGKPPRREPLEAYLKNFGTVSLKKSKDNKMFIATLSSFEHFDHLCHIENDLIDGCAVSFKPLHMTGPPPKVSAGAQRQKFIQAQIDTSGENLLEAYQPENDPETSTDNDNITDDVTKTENNENEANDDSVENNDVADDDSAAINDWGAGTDGWDDVTNNAGNDADDVTNDAGDDADDVTNDAGDAAGDDLNVDNIKMEDDDLEDWV